MNTTKATNPQPVGNFRNQYTRKDDANEHRTHKHETTEYEVYGLLLYVSTCLIPKDPFVFCTERLLIRSVPRSSCYTLRALSFAPHAAA